MKAKIISLTICVLFFFAVGYSQQMKFFGCIWQRTPAANFSQYFDQITPENAGKWGNVNYNTLDQMFDYAAQHNMQTKQHTFVWGQQTQNGASAQDVENWISGFMQRYPQVDMIDVVNEALPGHAQPDYKNNLGGDGATGWDWVLWTFETARRYAPNAKLLINDYNILNSTNTTNQYYNMIQVLKTGGNIDGIGCQAHFLENTSANTIQQNLDRLAELGLPIYISEFELHIANDQQHLAKMQEIFPVMWEHPMVGGVTVWGYVQGTMWRANGWLVQQNGTERPAMTWLKNYLAANPLPAPNTGTGIIKLNKKVPKTHSRILYSDQLNGVELGKNLRIFSIDGKALNNLLIPHNAGARKRMPVILLENEPQ